ncbi:MAG: hypothetical protein MUQ27_08545, partial [Acidimicrobiia bacterium]|nr:hypothetical protein [Acidimicrobiia bacterium]
VGLQAPGPGRPKRGFARVVALAAVIMVTAGSIWFASADDHGSGSAGIIQNGGGGRGGARRRVGINAEVSRRTSRRYQRARTQRRMAS